MSGRWGASDAKPLAEMPRAELLRRIAKLDAESSDLNKQLIQAGHGLTKIQDILKMSDPLSQKYKKNHEEQMELRAEREHRMRYQGTEHPVKKSKWL
jgi:hypothetical protein